MNLVDAYTAFVSLAHRKSLAQFFTPPRIAQFMVRWVLAGEGRQAVHDPAFGLGAFLDAAPDNCEFTGADSDDAVLDFFDAHVQRKPASLKRADYLLDFGRKYANIVCNPPYLRFQKFANRDAVFNAFCGKLGVRLSGYTNIASAFLVKSLSELEPGGRLAYIMPSEFLNSGYGEMVKAELIRNGYLDSIIEIECEQEAFAEVTTSLCIVLYDSAFSHGAVAFRKIVSLDELRDVMERDPVCEVPLTSLNPSDKWERYFSKRVDMPRPAMRHLGRISDFGHFSRGIATGANGFFVLSKSDIEKHGLGNNSFLPCITKSQQIKGLVFTDADFASLAASDSRVFLFAPGDNPDAASRNYIRKGEGQKIDQRYITSHRTPWYKTEVREAAPILLNVFSRSGYKVVRNLSSALSLTNFHCFYPIVDRKNYIDWLFLYLCSDAGRKLLSLSKRKYGNALDKFEPNDLNGALAPSRAFLDSLDRETLFSIMDDANAGKSVSSRADAIFASLLDGTQALDDATPDSQEGGRLFYRDCEDDSKQLLFAMETTSSPNH